MNSKDKLLADYNRYLVGQGVEWPGPLEEIGLRFLYQNMPNGVTQEDITAHYLTQGKQYNKQLRHVSDRGWYIATGNSRATRMFVDKQLKRNELALLSTTAPNPVWVKNNQLKRKGRLGASNWKELLRYYDKHGCAVCGQKHKHYDKGHLDPTKKAVLSNIVPMCTKCNNWAGAYNVSFSLDGDIARPVIPRQTSSKP